MTLPETQSRRDQPARQSSDRSFGLVFCGLFLVIGLYPLVDGNAPRGWALLVSAGLCAMALLQPQWLHGPNVLWGRFGALLQRISSPLLLGVIFFLVITPIGLLLRLSGKRPLQLKFAPDSPSYWQHRETAQTGTSSMTRQF